MLNILKKTSSLNDAKTLLVFLSRKGIPFHVSLDVIYSFKYTLKVLISAIKIENHLIFIYKFLKCTINF